MNSSPPAHLHGLCVCTHCLSLPSGTAHELHGYTPIHLLGSKFSLFALASRPLKIWLILVFLTMSPELSFSVPKVWSHWFSCWASCMSSLFLPQHLCVSCYFCLEVFPPRYFHVLLAHCTQISAPVSSPQTILPGPLCPQ